MNHTQRYVRSCEKATELALYFRENSLNPSSPEARWLYIGIDEVTPIDVHISMFIPSLQYQTSKEQQERWLGPAKRFEILGAYAQTELGHGSNVRGLETTATYDQTTQEFVLHTPTLTATKWWPGGLGKTATHCIAHARLILNGKDYGVHPFFVQLRSLHDHTSLPGITLGDIGPKVGFNSVDNGFAQFNQVRIPRDHMLMGFAEVTADGRYVKRPGGEKLAYGAMLDVRANLVIRASFSLARALTIAVRYSAVRHQGFVGDGKTQERAVLDYPTQQHALMPLLGWVFALHFQGKKFKEAYETYLKDLDISKLPALHASSSGLKALITGVVSDGIETCRKMCGGHGYSQFSGIHELNSDYLALCTLEGTQQVLEPQTARYLINSLRTKGGDDVAYLQDGSCLSKCQATRMQDFLDPELQVVLFQKRSLQLIQKAKVALDQMTESGMSQADAYSMCGVYMGKASRAHCQLLLLQEFWQGIRDIKVGKTEASLNQSEIAVLENLASLFALSVMEKEMGEFRNGDLLSSQQSELVSEQALSLCSAVRANAVALMDSWSFTDEFLNSALAPSNGDVYASLFELAQTEPLNATDVTEGYLKYLKQLINPSARL